MSTSREELLKAAEMFDYAAVGYDSLGDILKATKRKEYAKAIRAKAEAMPEEPKEKIMGEIKVVRCNNTEYCDFHTRQVLLPDGGYISGYSDLSATKGGNITAKAIGREILAFAGVTEVGVRKHYITVHKDDIYTWDELEPKIIAILERHLGVKAEAMGEKKPEPNAPRWTRDATNLIYSGKMPIATVLATIAGWVKWLLKENGMINDLAARNCPLCERFLGTNPINRCSREEERCPLFTKHNLCADTPWLQTSLRRNTDADREMRLHIEGKIPVEFKPLLDGIQYAIKNAIIKPDPQRRR